jgi:acetoin utilization deacetylase AcuC-like enzyme
LRIRAGDEVGGVVRLLAVKCAYHPAYEVPLSPAHPFPMSKYPLLKARLLEEQLIAPRDLIQPEPLARNALARVHTAAYLEKLYSGSLSAAEIRRLGLPWSPALWQRSLLASAGTLLAARLALQQGLAANLAGGTHHAFADHGEGFCVLNDVAIAIAQLRAEGAIQRAAVIDLDVHQGNGTASIFEHDASVFTFSMHGERNYPTAKMRSTLDVALPNGTDDEHYARALDAHLPRVLAQSRPDLAFYIAGVDVAAGDRYGKLALTEEGIRARDQYVIDSIRAAGVPLVITLGGGYAVTRDRTAELHTHVFRAAVAHERKSDANPHLPV